MPDVPILGTSGPNGRRPAEMYIPGRRYLLAVLLDTGDQLTAGVNINIPIDQVPDPFVPEEIVARWAGQQAAQHSVTRSEEGTWLLWAHITAFTYLGAADALKTAPKLDRPVRWDS